MFVDFYLKVLKVPNFQWKLLQSAELPVTQATPASLIFPFFS